MSDRFLALKVFVRVARLGSFSCAARELGLSQPSVSRIMAELEREVGAALIMRSTRALALTDAGMDYLGRAEALLDALEEADLAARGTGELRGSLKIGISSSFGAREVIPSLPDFCAAHPALSVQLAVDDQYQNLIAEGVDVAFRFGVLTDSSATAKLLDRTPRLVLASPSYLKTHGRPTTPDALTKHAIVIGPAGGGPSQWSFAKEGRRVAPQIQAKVSANSNEAAVTAAIAGMGIVSTVYWGCRSELEQGRLVELLADWSRESIPLHAVFAAGRATKAAARAFVDHFGTCLAERRRRPPGL